MKMKLRMVVVSLGLSFVGSLALAKGGSEAGNGGSSIVCQDSRGQITSVELLDFYEGRTQRGIKVDMGPATDSVETKLALVVQRLETLEPVLASTMAEYIQQFPELSHFYSGVRLVEIPDSQNLFIPVGCQQEQIAIWRQPSVPEDKLFNINQDLWDRLDNDNKAGLILHEVLYYIVSANNSLAPTSDSRIVRYFVSKISSADATKWNLWNFVDTLRLLGCESFSHKGYSYSLLTGGPYFTNDGQLIGGRLVSAQHVNVQGKPVLVDSLYWGSDGSLVTVGLFETVSLTVDGQIVWFQRLKPLLLENDHVTEGYAIPNSKNVFKRPGAYELKIKSVEGVPVQLKFATNGTLEFCRTCEGTVTFQGKTYPVGVPPSHNDGSGWDYSSYFLGFFDFRIFLRMPTSVPVGTRDLLLEGQTWFYRDTGKFAEGRLAEVTVLEVGARTVKFGPNSISFRESGELASGTLAEDVVLTGVDGKDTMYWEGMTLTFTKEGQVMEVISLNRTKNRKGQVKK